MSISFELNAEPRRETGKGASRRLRHAKKIPAVVYGQNKTPVSITLDEAEVTQRLEHEAFFSHVITLHLDGKPEKVIVRDLQRHPYKPLVSHMDFLRISEKEKLRMSIPLHFVGGDEAAGVKLENGVLSHDLNEVEVECLPQHIPEYLEVDVSKLHVGDSVHLSQIPLPEAVELVELMHGEEHDLAVASVYHAKAAAEEVAVPEEAEAAAEEIAAPEEEAGGEEGAGGEGEAKE
ncbi:MAG: 50S ribosomal protein L25/general stress protein Ctc [Gammaproteobacteria bacterium]|nr:50S ribosomal protein L25/general stress protein Ctc [Gammaproteobacteria bacterium]